MRSKPKVISSALFLILLLVCDTFSKGENMSEKLDLILRTDKTIYSVGDEVELTYIFLNKSNAGIYLLPWGGQYATNWITVYNEKGMSLEGMPLVYYEIKLIPAKEDFFFLKPNDMRSIAIKGRIIRSALSRFNRDDQKKQSGIFINFDNSAVFLDKPGNFTIKATYKGLFEWKDKGEKLYSLNDVWTGDLRSNDVKIIVKE